MAVYFEELIKLLSTGIMVFFIVGIFNMLIEALNKKERTMMGIHTVQSEQYDQLIDYLYFKGYSMKKLTDWEKFKGRTVVIIDINYYEVVSVMPIEEVKNFAVYFENADLYKI